MWLTKTIIGNKDINPCQFLFYVCGFQDIITREKYVLYYLSSSSSITMLGCWNQKQYKYTYNTIQKPCSFPKTISVFNVKKYIITNFR